MSRQGNISNAYTGFERFKGAPHSLFMRDSFVFFCVELQVTFFSCRSTSRKPQRRRVLLNLHGDLCYEAAHGVIPGKGVSLPLWFGVRERERERAR